MLQNLIIAIIIAAISAPKAAKAQSCEGLPVGTLLPNPEDCSTFYQCTNSGPLLMPCAPDLHFSPKTGKCEYPEIAECASTGELCRGLPIGTLLPDPNDCGSFYLCTFTGSTKVSCPNGLHFNPKSRECEPPELAGCQDNDDDDEAAGIPCPGDDDPETLIIFPSEKNCAWYYICINGRATRFECAPGLHWNQEAMRCDLPENANCKIGQSSTPEPSSTTTVPGTTSTAQETTSTITTPGETTSTAPQTTSTTPEQTTTTTTTEWRTSPGGDFTCPARGASVHPHPTHCDRFIFCYDGFKTVQQCQMHYNFDAIDSVCVLKGQARCAESTL